MSSVELGQQEVPSSHIPSPIWLNKDCYTKSILSCSICYDVPFDPVVTSCNHLFCRTCLNEALQHKKCCPLDRTRISSMSQLKTLDGIAKRIWSDIPVQCPTCFIWTGTFDSYRNEHGTTCVDLKLRVKELEVKIQKYESMLRCASKKEKTNAQLLRERESIIHQLQSTLEGTYVSARQKQSMYEYRLSELENRIAKQDKEAIQEQQNDDASFKSTDSGCRNDRENQYQGMIRHNYNDVKHQLQQKGPIGKSIATTTTTSTNAVPLSSSQNTFVETTTTTTLPVSGNDILTRLPLGQEIQENGNQVKTTGLSGRRIVRARRPTVGKKGS